LFPTEKELIAFIKKKNLVNLTMIAKHFDVSIIGVSDLIASLEKKKALQVKKMGGQKLVSLK